MAEKVITIIAGHLNLLHAKWSDRVGPNYLFAVYKVCTGVWFCTIHKQATFWRLSSAMILF